MTATTAEARNGAPTGLVYHPDCLTHDTGYGHPERPARLEAIVGALEREDLLTPLLRIEPRPAEETWIAKVHRPALIERIKAAVAQAPAYLDPDTPVSTESYEVARLAAGGLLAAVDAVMEGRARNAFAAVRPPGHHATPGRAMGFCLLNNVAIAARYAQEKHGIGRVLIVDWDVHHGNGTQEAFYTDPSVLYFSSHQYPFYPGSGSEQETGAGEGLGATVNAPLPAGSGDEEVLSAFRDKLLPAAEAFEPEFVLVSAGFDAHADDPLAGLRMTDAGYGQLTQIVMDIAARFASGRVVSTLEGGYDLEALGRAVAVHVRTLMEYRPQ